LKRRKDDSSPGHRKSTSTKKTNSSRPSASPQPIADESKRKDGQAREAATSEILQLISEFRSDIQPVFDAIAQRARDLCSAEWAGVHRYDGEFVYFNAHAGFTAEAIAVLSTQIFPYRPAEGGTGIARALRERKPVHIDDLRADSAWRFPVMKELPDYRTVLMVPMLRRDEPLGVISVGRSVVRPFSDEQIKLLQVFASQAVIAIENVRLFNELQTRNAALTEALEQQTATSDILRVISSSPTEIRPVLDAVAKSAARLCEANDAIIFRVDGDDLEVTTVYGPLGVHGDGTRRPISRGWVTGRAVVDRKTIHIHDLAAESDTEFPLGRALRSLGGHRTTLATPLLRENTPLGAILIRRTEVRPFTDKQIELLQTFADQAVIAIENVRLFTELQQRNSDLTEALDQQTATSEVLRVLSGSPRTEQPVFETILRSGVRLSDAIFGSLYRFDGALIHLVANHNIVPEQLEPFKRTFPRPLSEGGRLTDVLTSGRALRIADVFSYPGMTPIAVATFREMGVRSALFVPMLQHEKPIGVIALFHRHVSAFNDSHVTLLETFADQAVIAIENVRLFRELETRNSELTEALEQQTATSEILRVISDSAFDIQPVLVAVAEKAARLCDAVDGALLRVRDRMLWPVAHYGPAGLPTPQQIPTGQPINRDWLSGRAVVDKRTIHVPDLLAAAEEYPYGHRYAEQYGHRTTLAVPLIREDDAIGVILVRRLEVRPFTDMQIQLLQTFARQAVIAIENVRMFNEIQEKTIQLQAANRHKDEFLASMSHELRTPLNAVIGFSEVLLERMFGDVNEKQEEYLNDILASGRHLLSLINDILDLTKIEAGRMELDLEDFDVSVAIDNALVLIRERATRKGLSLDWTTGAKLGTIRGDQRKFKQILLNLMSNALKFTLEGGRIELRATRRNGDIEVSVSDTGVGIAVEDHRAVFEEFRQVGDAVQRREGTGLGLALSRKFVELHGGRMWLESELGKGSTFTFTLPTTPPIRRD
jgi:two-component system, NtrC family, sensor kinase